MSCHDLIRRLQLLPHPEGGYYRRTFESPEKIETSHGLRPAVTCILYLLRGDEFSAWHRIQSVERWFHHQGDGINVYQAVASRLQVSRLDALPTEGCEESLNLSPYLDVAPQTWFAARKSEGAAGYSLCSCMVTPGFDFADFELAVAGDIEAALSEPYRREAMTLIRPPVHELR